jgi:hypothetical protein
MKKGKKREKVPIEMISNSRTSQTQRYENPQISFNNRPSEFPTSNYNRGYQNDTQRNNEGNIAEAIYQQKSLYSPYEI